MERPNYQYAIIDRTTNRVLETWTSPYDAGHTDVKSHGDRRAAYYMIAGQDGTGGGGARYCTWVYVEEPCSVGDRLLVDADGCAAVITDVEGNPPRGAVPEKLVERIVAAGLHDDGKTVVENAADLLHWLLSGGRVPETTASQRAAVSAAVSHLWRDLEEDAQTQESLEDWAARVWGP